MCAVDTHTLRISKIKDRYIITNPYGAFPVPIYCVPI
jgi:hypothetical protein